MDYLNNQEQEYREALYRRSLAGDRARMMLDDLSEYQKKEEQGVLARLAAAGTPEAAFLVACEWRALNKLMSSLRAEAAVGEDAGRQLLEGE